VDENGMVQDVHIQAIGDSDEDDNAASSSKPNKGRPTFNLKFFFFNPTPHQKGDKKVA
jgi:hypothetical protein